MKVILLMLIFAVQLEAQSRVILWASTAADLGTTLNHGPQLREGNPILGQNKTRQAVTMIGLTALSDWSSSRMKHGAKVRLAIAAVHVFCVGWNFSSSFRKTKNEF